MDDKRERKPALWGVIHTIIHQSIHPHTRTSWSRLYDLFVHGSFIWLYNIWNASMPCSYPTLSSIKALFIVGKPEGNYCPGKEAKSWVLRENHFEELLGILTMRINPQAHRYCHSIHPWVFKGIISIGNVRALTPNSVGPKKYQDMWRGWRGFLR